MEHITLIALIVTQVIIESLPISSSGHVALTGLLSTRLFGIQNTALPDFLDHLLHGTALIAILIVFFKDWFFLIKKLTQCSFQFMFKQKPLSFIQKKLFTIFIKIVRLIFMADLMTGILYFFVKIMYKDFFKNLGPIFLLLGFIITMLLLFSLKLKLWAQQNNKNTAESFDFKKAIVLGLVQGCALLPGVSRFASTYVAGCWLNLSPRRAFQISFLIHLPLIIAAFLFLGVKDIFKSPEILQGIIRHLNYLNLSIILTATILATLALKICYRLAIKNKLWWFGIYMLIPIFTLINVLR